MKTETISWTDKVHKEIENMNIDRKERDNTYYF